MSMSGQARVFLFAATCCFLSGCNTAPLHPADPTGEALAKLAVQLYQTGFPVGVIQDSDTACGLGQISPFSQRPVIELATGDILTVLRYSGTSHVCVDVYSHKAGGVRFREDQFKPLIGKLPPGRTYAPKTSFAFIVKNVEDWQKLFLSVPRYVDPSRPGSLAATVEPTSQGAAKEFAQQTAHTLGLTAEAGARCGHRSYPSRRAPSAMVYHGHGCHVILLLVFAAALGMWMKHKPKPSAATQDASIALNRIVEKSVIAKLENDNRISAILATLAALAGEEAAQAAFRQALRRYNEAVEHNLANPVMLAYGFLVIEVTKRQEFAREVSSNRR